MTIIVNIADLREPSKDKPVGAINLTDLRVPTEAIEVADLIIYQSGAYHKILKDRFGR